MVHQALPRRLALVLQDLGSRAPIQELRRAGLGAFLAAVVDQERRSQRLGLANLLFEQGVHKIVIGRLGQRHESPVPGREKALEVALELEAGQCGDVHTHCRPSFHAKPLEDVPKGGSTTQWQTSAQLLLLVQDQFALEWPARDLQDAVGQLSIEIIPFGGNALDLREGCRALHLVEPPHGRDPRAARSRNDPGVERQTPLSETAGLRNRIKRERRDLLPGPSLLRAVAVGTQVVVFEVVESSLSSWSLGFSLCIWGQKRPHRQTDTTTRQKTCTSQERIR